MERDDCQKFFVRLFSTDWLTRDEAYGNIPSEWKSYTAFIGQEMEQCQVDKNHPKPFTAAHQINGLGKLVETKEDFEKKKSKIVKGIKGAMSLEDCFKAIREIQYVGPFFAWQITADLMEVKLVTLPCSWTELGPGAKEGQKQIFTVMDSVFKGLGIGFKSFLGTKMSLKTVEHALCEFDKYARAAASKLN